MLSENKKQKVCKLFIINKNILQILAIKNKNFILQYSK